MGIIPRIIGNIIYAVELIILVECILSWFIRDGRNEIMRILRTITNPILEPFRRLQDNFLGNMAVDLSPFLAILALQLIAKLIFIIL